MRRHTERPSCWTDAAPAPRGQHWLGNKDGVRPGWRIAFDDDGRKCQNARTPGLWEFTKEHTPGCLGCHRAIRSIALWGVE